MTACRIEGWLWCDDCGGLVAGEGCVIKFKVFGGFRKTKVFGKLDKVGGLC